MKKKAFNRDHAKDNEKHVKGRIPIHKALRAAAKPGARLMLMPGSGIEEIEVAVEHGGFAVEDMIFVDDNPAVLANCTRKLAKRYPDLEISDAVPARKGMLLSDACWHWARLGVTVDAASLDFTGTLDSHKHGRPPSEIEAFCQSCVMVEGHVAIWMLFGRDPKITKYVGVGGRDESVEARHRILLHRLRLDLLKSRIPRTATEVARGQYKNGSTKNTMLWAVYKIQRKLEDK